MQKQIFILLAMTVVAFAQSPSRVFVVNKTANAISIVSVSPLRVEKTIPVGQNPHELAVAPNGAKVYVANAGGNSISVVELKTQTETAKITHPDFSFPHGVAFTPDSKVAIVTSERSRKLFVIDAVADRVLRAIDTDQGGAHMTLVNKAGSEAYVANRESNTVSFLSLRDYRITATVPVGPGAEGFALSPDEKEIWTGNRGNATLSVVDIARKAVVATLPSGRNPVRMTFTPDGKHVLVPDGGTGSVDVYEAASRRKVQSIPVGAGAGGITVGADGRHAYVACQGANEVYVIDLETWKVSGRVSVPAGPDGISVH